VRWQSLGTLSVLTLLATATVSHAQQPADPFRAQTEVRITRLENEIRRLTGNYEEAMYRLTQLNQQLEKQLEDMQFRIQTLERQLEQGAAAGTASAGGAPPADGAMPADDTALAGDGPTRLPGPPDAAAPGDSGPPPARGGRVADTLSDQLTAPGGTPPPPRGAPEETPDRYLEGDTPETQFQYAFSLLRRDDLQGAEQALRAFLALHPEHRIAPNAKYWLGKTYFAQKNYAEAARVLLDGYRQFADSDKGPDMVLTLGLSLQQLGENEQACATFDELNRRYPQAPASVKQKAEAGRQAAGCQ
jgi:tol-pal system protein YbgF